MKPQQTGDSFYRRDEDGNIIGYADATPDDENGAGADSSPVSEQSQGESGATEGSNPEGAEAQQIAGVGTGGHSNEGQTTAQGEEEEEGSDVYQRDEDGNIVGFADADPQGTPQEEQQRQQQQASSEDDDEESVSYLAELGRSVVGGVTDAGEEMLETASWAGQETMALADPTPGTSS